MDTGTGRPLRAPLTALGFGLALCLVQGGLLFGLLWWYVPTYAALFEAMGMALPAATRWVILASMWLGRLLPFLLLAGLVGASLLVTVGAAVARRRGAAVALETAAAVALTVALLLAAAFGFSVFALQLPMQHVFRAVEDGARASPAPRPTAIAP